MKSTLLILLCLPFSLFAQIKFKHISVDDGLSQSAVRAFTQDSLGYLWVATRDGLNQYDGSNFQVYRHKEGDMSSIANNIIWAVCSDPDRGVWAATASGVSYFDPMEEIFYNYAPPNLKQDFPISNTLVFMGERLLIATQEGLWIFNTNSKEWKKFPYLKQTVTAFAQGLDENRILVGNINGLFLYSIKEDSLTQLLSDTLKNCKAFYQTSQDLLIVSSTDLFVLDQDFAIKKVVQFNEISTTFNRHITEDQEGRFWISGSDIYLLNNDYSHVQQLRYNRFDEFSLASSSTTDVYTSDDGTVWIGTNGFGINKYNKHLAAITTLSYNPFNENSLSEMYAVGLYAEDNLLYAGTLNGVDIFDYTTYPSKKIKEVNLSDYRSGLVNKILPLPNAKLLLGTEKGLLELNEKVNIRIKDLRIFDLALLSDGNILIATAFDNEGLLVYNSKDFTYTPLQLIPKNFSLRCILVEDEQIWIGSDHGLFKVSPSLDSYELLQKNETPYPTQIKCIFRDSLGILWVGTWGQGLYRYHEDEKIFELFEMNEQLPNQTIYGILEDARNNLWMSSNNGLICYQRNEGQLISFSAKQGLQSNEFNTGSYYMSADSTMFFGGINGISYFTPSKLLTIPNFSRLFITNIWVNQQRLDKSDWVNGSLILQPEQQNIRLDFTSVSFNSASAIQYRYKLMGQDSYIDNGSINHINLSNLSPGHYQVLINCTDAYGRWKEEQASFSFTILKPIWQRPWFIALVLTALVALGLLYNYLRVRNYRKKNERLEQAVKDRTVQITDQNNEILAQNEELLAQGNLLSEQNSQLEQQHHELLELKNSLEKRVEERTADLHHKNKELEVQYKHIEQFSYITSHNLKGPIASLKGLLFLLPELNNSADKEIIENIQKSVLKLDSIINDLASIMDLRKNKDRFKVISVSNVLKQVVNDLKEECQHKNVKLIVEESLDDVKIKGLKAYLYSILYNLIHNSIKYKKARVDQAYVKISVHKNAESVHIEVSDNGIGIDMKYAKHKLFRLFQRFTNMYEGKGIGLYMTKIQVESMNGTISLDSKEGEGTRVKVSFPIAE